MSKNKKRGWFFGAEGDGIVSDGSNGLEPVADPSAGEVGPAAEGALDLKAIFDYANISHEDRERVVRARALLEALPHSANADVRRQIVEAALTTFGVPTDRIVEAALRETAALDAYIATHQQSTDKLIEEGRARIHALEQEILRVKHSAEHATAVHQACIHSANAEMASVHKVLSFFGRPGVDVAVDVFEEPTEDRRPEGWPVEIPVSRSAAKLKSRTVPPPTPPPTPPADPNGSAGSQS